jgi:hypothetical protein
MLAHTCSQVIYNVPPLPQQLGIRCAVLQYFLYGGDDGHTYFAVVQRKYFVYVQPKAEVIGYPRVVMQVFFIRFHHLEHRVSAVTDLPVLTGSSLFAPLRLFIAAGNVIAYYQVGRCQLKPFSLYTFVLEYGMEALFQAAHLGRDILSYKAENDGQMGMVGGKPLLKILRFADLVKVLPGFQDVDGMAMLQLLHKNENKVIFSI